MQLSFRYDLDDSGLTRESVQNAMKVVAAFLLKLPSEWHKASFSASLENRSYTALYLHCDTFGSDPQDNFTCSVGIPRPEEGRKEKVSTSKLADELFHSFAATITEHYSRLHREWPPLE